MSPCCFFGSVTFNSTPSSSLTTHKVVSSRQCAKLCGQHSSSCSSALHESWHNRIVRYGNVMTMSRNSVITLCLCSKSQGRCTLQGLCTSCKMEPMEVWHAYQLRGQHGSLRSGRESKGKGYRREMRRGEQRTENREQRTENREQRTENREQRKIVTAQQACESLHSWGSHTEMRGIRPRLPSILIY